MPLVAKSLVNLSFGNMSNIMDLGEFYAAGPLLLRKDLKVSQLAKMFSLTDINGNAFSSSIGYATYTPSTGLASPLYLKGSGASVKTGEQSVTTVLNGCYPNMEAMFDESGSSCNYFDSKTGSTAGKRLAVAMVGSQANSSYPNVCLGIVGASGDVQWVNRGYPQDTGGGRVFIFGESATYLYAYIVCHFASSAGDGSSSIKRRLGRIDKTTGVLTYMMSDSAISIYGNYLKYCGRTSDNKHWFLAPCAAASVNSRTLYWVVVDCSTDTAYYSSNITVHASVYNTVGQFTPSAFAVNKVDPTKLKCYSIVDQNNATSSLAIKMMSIPASGQALTNNWTPPAPTVCTIVGDPGIGMPYTTATAGAHAHQSECWQFADGDNEYLAIAYHATLDSCSAYYGNNLCPISKHGIHVFLIDPTDPTKLTYKSSLTNNAFGANATLPILLKSVDSKVLVAANSNGFTPITWNSATQSYVNGQWTPIQLMNIHLDNANQIFVRDYSSNLYVFNVGQSINIVVNFDAVSAVYAGSDLTINALVGAFDMMGVRVAQEVQLIVSGGKFAGDAVSIKVTTSDAADVPVPITVSEAGQLVVTPVL